MAITSLDILNLSHSLKDICEVDCKCPSCLSQSLMFLLQYNLLQSNLQYSKQFECPPRRNSSSLTVGDELIEDISNELDLTNPLRPAR